MKITTWPVLFDTWQSTLALPQHVLRDTRSVDVSPRCHGRHPRVCRCGLITQATTYSCLTHLLAANPTYHPSCVIVVQRRIPIDTIHPHQNNGLVLTTNGTTLIKRCAGQVERAATLEAGVYRLQLTFPCSLHGKDCVKLKQRSREKQIEHCRQIQPELQ